jgi:hypothetical protein
MMQKRRNGNGFPEIGDLMNGDEHTKDGICLLCGKKLVRGKCMNCGICIDCG